jgi:hypothetical protein
MLAGADLASIKRKLVRAQTSLQGLKASESPPELSDDCRACSTMACSPFA